MSEEFVNHRRVKLNGWLNRVHRLPGAPQVLDDFFSTEMKQRGKKAKPAKPKKQKKAPAPTKEVQPQPVQTADQLVDSCCSVSWLYILISMFVPHHCSMF